MDYEILETPLQFHLHGKSDVVEDERYAEVGLRLMDEMWRVVKTSGVPHGGINHWVYLSGDRMFVGVELKGDAPAPDGLEPLGFELRRYLKHLHVGPYQALPQKWKALMGELAARGETIRAPSLEVYGHHHCDEPSRLETTILIQLRPNPA